jgi:hypothetical protein
VMRFPTGMRPWRLFPPSRGPGVSVAIPAMVPGNPHMVGARWATPILDYDTRWRDANHNFSRQRAEGQRTCKNQSDQPSRKHNTLSHSRAIWTYLQRSSSVSSARGWPRAITQYVISRLARAPAKPAPKCTLLHSSTVSIQPHPLGSRAGRAGISLNGGNQEVLRRRNERGVAMAAAIREC